MAVLLSREHDELLSPRRKQPQAEHLPRVVVKSLPVHAAKDSLKSAITGRTETVYSQSEPERTTHWKRNYDRRQTQFTECGFHSTPERAYKDIGGVQLNDRDLILEALGQNDSQMDSSPRDTTAKITHYPTFESPTLRARTPGQFPSEMLSLQAELKAADENLFLMTKGQGLFERLREKQTEKHLAHAAAVEAVKKVKASEWKPATVEPISVLQASLFNDCDAERDVHISEPVPSEHDNEEEEESPDNSLGYEPSSKDDNGTNETSTSIRFVVEKWYRELCVILWVLESMKMDSPAHMPPLQSYWKINRPAADEVKGRLRHEQTQGLLKQWEYNIAKPKRIPGWVAVMKHFRTLGKSEDGKEKVVKPLVVRPTSEISRKILVEQKLRAQKKLTPEQMEQLSVMVEEELNNSKKKTRETIKEMMQASTQKWMQNESRKRLSSSSSSNFAALLDVERARDKFSEVEEGRKMIVHEQLSVMQRDRQPAMEQRFASLQVTGSIWNDLAQMRSGVAIETTAMARNKLLMNYNWMADLHQLLPSEVLSDRYCVKLLTKLGEIQQYMREVGPQKMSQKNLIKVLGTLRPWELHSPEICASVQFITQHVIYIVPEDYQAWESYHFTVAGRTNIAKR